MSRVAIPVSALDRTGVAQPAQTTADATNKHTLANPSSRTLLEIVSSDAGSQSVDFELVTAAVDGVTVPPKTVTVAAGATVYVGPFPKSFYNQGAVAADGTLTSDGTAPANADTVTIDGHVYTYKTTLTGIADEVLIGASAAAALTNLKAAINGSSGAGSTYGTGTVAHATVTASTLTSTTLLVVAQAAGTAGNALATTETSAHLAWGAATLAGGLASGTVVFANPSVSTTLKFRAYSV
jgi:hypothetical protein